MGLIIAGISSGSGKTTFTIGLMRALKNRRLNVGAFKAGPDYIDPMFHRMAIEGPSYNLPTWMLPDVTLSQLYEKRSKAADISVVEGVMGYFDGHSFETTLGSTAHLAEVLGQGVVLIMDASSMALTAAAIIKGLVDFQSPSQIRGVVFNKIKSDSHYALLKNSVETHTDIKCYGYLKPCDAVQLESRHLGLIQAGEYDDIEQKIEKMAQLVEETVDVERLIADFRNSKTSMTFQNGQQTITQNTINADVVSRLKEKIQVEGGLTVGVALDKAFSFYYDENLATLLEIGVSLVPFSPIEDTELPEGLDALYLGGGYPEVFAEKLSLNRGMRESILNKSRAGLPIYAECGGLMYLMSELVTSDGLRTEMVGVFHGVAHMTDRLQHFGHVEAKIEAHKLFGDMEVKDVFYRGHEFHHSVIEMIEPFCAIEVAKNKESWQCGYIENNTLATYVHNHFYSNLEFLEMLIHFFSLNK